MKSKILCGSVLAALLAAGAPQFSSAQEMSYSFIEGGVSWLDLDGVSGTETGFNLRGSIDLNGGFYLQGTYDSWDVGPFDVDLYRIGAGYRHSVQEATDVFFELSYAAFEVGSVDDDGFRAEIGVRQAFGNRAEGRVYGGYQGDGSDGDVVLGTDLLIKFNDAMGISAGVESYELDSFIYRANLRFSF